LTVKIFVSVTVWGLVFVSVQAVADAVIQLQALEIAVAFSLWYEAVFFSKYSSVVEGFGAYSERQK